MFEYVEFELTNKCNAACPQCPRVDSDFTEILKHTDQEVRLADIMKWFDKTALDSMKKVVFKGTFSDPIIAKDFFEIVEFFIKQSQAIIRIHTNGSLRKTDWWAKLGNLIQDRGICIFGIDGLSDTHAIYRVNTNYEKVIENATAFINAGGIAHWQFIVFKHNQHQIETAKAESKRLNFEKFFTFGSDRFYEDDHVVTTKKNNIIEKSNLVDSNTREDYKNLQKSTRKVVCESELINWIVIDWTGEIFPCCMSQVWKQGIVRKDFGASYWYKKIVKDPINSNLHTAPISDIRNLLLEFYSHLNKKIIPQVCSHHCSAKN
jgi:MoaA/NifB/PqqE/SkfB family radical SAM enzyme